MSVKAMLEIPLARKAKNVADVPGMVEFTSSFRQVWEALEISVPGAANAAEPAEAAS